MISVKYSWKLPSRGVVVRKVNHLSTYSRRFLRHAKAAAAVGCRGVLLSGIIWCLTCWRHCRAGGWCARAAAAVSVLAVGGYGFSWKATSEARRRRHLRRFAFAIPHDLLGVADYFGLVSISGDGPEPQLCW